LTVAVPLQLVNVMGPVGFTLNAGAGQTPAAWPERVTVTFFVVWPSETPTRNGPVPGETPLFWPRPIWKKAAWIRFTKMASLPELPM
jgi:hypothetical protein